MLTKYSIIPILFILFSSCSDKLDNQTDAAIDVDSVETFMGFQKIDSSHSGITFLNSITETNELNHFNYEDIYSGGGVAVGDVNNDGLVDIYFTGNHVSDKLYLNKGDLKFEDITESAFNTDLSLGWHTGVCMVDLNADGWLDIYVCRSGERNKRELFSNLLFINNQDGTFTEKAAEYGVDLSTRTMNAAFFDYDNDSDLDLYVLNHPAQYDFDGLSNLEMVDKKKNGEATDSDVFLENRDGKFVDASSSAGIANYMFGLGIGVSDIDGNGFEDIYISNDYEDPDLMYMNNGDGTFSEEIKSRTNHISNYSMGNDIADINNDGYLDILTLDMASEDHVRSKKNMSGMSSELFWKMVDIGFHHQYMFNCLQLNNGDATFSEIGQMAGISKTDWSWAPLFADFDNDGSKDLFITNGFQRDLRDNDFNNEYLEKREEGTLGDLENQLSLIPSTKIENYMYQNQNDLTFKKVTAEWGLDIPINSNGAAYADLDNDGDLDLIVNNMEEASAIFENKLSSSESNFSRLKIGGYEKNTQAIGTKVTIHTTEGIQFQELQVSRGYISSVESTIHFGLGKEKSIEKIVVEWLDGTSLIVENPVINKTIELKYQNGVKQSLPGNDQAALFRDISDSLLNFQHKELNFNDFSSEILLPNKLSQSGPFMATGDVNGDGLEDIYISAPLEEAGKLMIQTATGFTEKTGPWKKEDEREEMQAIFLDVDNDSDLDLYVVSGGNEYFFSSPFLIDQLYINDGQGNYTNESDRLPQIPIGGQSVTAGDYDQDGDLDLFIGGRQIPAHYPFVPKSYLYENNNGVFSDISKESPDLVRIGLVTDALFDDIDQDGDLDIVAVGEWMPVSFFENNNGSFSNVTELFNPSKDIGWWYSIEKGDLNADGKMDYIVGNLGENNKFHPSKNSPLEIYCYDFDENGTDDIVLGSYQDGICYPVRGRQCSSEQMPFIKDKFPTYSKFAVADLSGIYGDRKLETALHFSVTSFSSVVFMSEGAGFQISRLPAECQMGPINRSIIEDYNHDGHLDVLMAGNNYGVEVETIRYDAGRGVVLLGDGLGGLKVLSPLESGFMDNNDVKDIVSVRFKNRRLIMTASNKAKVKTFLLRE